MTRVRLCFSLGRVGQQETLGNDDLDFPLIDQPSDFGQLIALRFDLKGYAANPVFVQLRLIDAPNKTHQDSTLFTIG